MKAQFDHILLSSFYLWLEARLLNSDHKAYITDLPNNFRYVDFDDIPADMVGYQGGYRQLVADHSVDVVNSGFFVDGGFVTGDSSLNGGVYTDYLQGRLLFPEASGVSMDISGNYTVKEINTYISYEDDLDFFLHSDFTEDGQDSPYSYENAENMGKGYFLPACFVSLTSSDNKEFSFGGEEDTKSRVRVMVLTKDPYILDSVISSLRDSVREEITHIPYEEYPYAYSHSLKDFPYVYDDLIEGKESKSFISNVTASKVVSETLREKMNANFSIGFLDFDLSTYRFPRT